VKLKPLLEFAPFVEFAPGPPLAKLNLNLFALALALAWFAKLKGAAFLKMLVLLPAALLPDAVLKEKGVEVEVKLKFVAAPVDVVVAAFSACIGAVAVKLNFFSTPVDVVVVADFSACIGVGVL